MRHSTTDAIIQLDAVSKTIAGREVLRQITLHVPAGSCYGISGHNGAGKSVLLRVIAGLVRPSTGVVRVHGVHVGKDVEFPTMTGIMIDGPGFLPQYSALRNLLLLAAIRKQASSQAVADSIRQVGLDPNDQRPVRTYSTGMRQRLGLAQAIMEQPKLLLLDEPTSAVDSEGRQAIHTLLRQLRQQGMTLLLTSHSQEELDTLCDAVFKMVDGTLENRA